MSKNMKKYIAIFAIIVVMYNVLVFAIPFPHKSELVFWFTWSFVMIALLIQPYVLYISMKGADSLKSKLYGWPIIRIGFIYLIVELGLSVLCYIIGAFVEIPFWILLVVNIILLGLAVIGLITTQTYKEEIEKMENNAPITTKFITNLKVDTKILAERCKDKSFANMMETLAEEVRFSDPVSADSLTEIEDEIDRKYIDLKSNIDSKDIKMVEAMITELIYLIKERNQRAKMSKK